MQKIKKSRRGFRDSQGCRYITLKKGRTGGYNPRVVYDETNLNKIIK